MGIPRNIVMLSIDKDAYHSWVGVVDPDSGLLKKELYLDFSGGHSSICAFEKLGKEGSFRIRSLYGGGGKNYVYVDEENFSVGITVFSQGNSTEFFEDKFGEKKVIGVRCKKKSRDLYLNVDGDKIICTTDKEKAAKLNTYFSPVICGNGEDLITSSGSPKIPKLPLVSLPGDGKLLSLIVSEDYRTSRGGFIGNGGYGRNLCITPSKKFPFDPEKKEDQYLEKYIFRAHKVSGSGVYKFESISGGFMCACPDGSEVYLRTCAEKSSSFLFKVVHEGRCFFRIESVLTGNVVYLCDKTQKLKCDIKNVYALRLKPTHFVFGTKFPEGVPREYVAQYFDEGLAMRLSCFYGGFHFGGSNETIGFNGLSRGSKLHFRKPNLEIDDCGYAEYALYHIYKGYVLYLCKRFQKVCKDPLKQTGCVLLHYYKMGFNRHMESSKFSFLKSVKSGKYVLISDGMGNNGGIHCAMYPVEVNLANGRLLFSYDTENPLKGDNSDAERRSLKVDLKFEYGYDPLKVVSLDNSKFYTLQVKGTLFKNNLSANPASLKLGSRESGKVNVANPWMHTRVLFNFENNTVQGNSTNFYDDSSMTRLGLGNEYVKMRCGGDYDIGYLFNTKSREVKFLAMSYEGGKDELYYYDDELQNIFPVYLDEQDMAVGRKYNDIYINSIISEKRNPVRISVRYGKYGVYVPNKKLRETVAIRMDERYINYNLDKKRYEINDNRSAQNTSFQILISQSGKGYVVVDRTNFYPYYFNLNDDKGWFDRTSKLDDATVFEIKRGKVNDWLTTKNYEFLVGERRVYGFGAVSKDSGSYFGVCNKSSCFEEGLHSNSVSFFKFDRKLSKEREVHFKDNSPYTIVCSGMTLQKMSTGDRNLVYGFGGSALSPGDSDFHFEKSHNGSHKGYILCSRGETRYGKTYVSLKGGTDELTLTTLKYRAIHIKIFRLVSGEGYVIKAWHPGQRKYIPFLQGEYTAKNQPYCVARVVSGGRECIRASYRDVFQIVKKTYEDEVKIPNTDMLVSYHDPLLFEENQYGFVLNRNGRILGTVDEVRKFKDPYSKAAFRFVYNSRAGYYELYFGKKRGYYEMYHRYTSISTSSRVECSTSEFKESDKEDIDDEWLIKNGNRAVGENWYSLRIRLTKFRIRKETEGNGAYSIYFYVKPYIDSEGVVAFPSEEEVKLCMTFNDLSQVSDTAGLSQPENTQVVLDMRDVVYSNRFGEYYSDKGNKYVDYFRHFYEVAAKGGGPREINPESFFDFTPIPPRKK